MDENANPGNYGFRLVGGDKPHYFSSAEQQVVREWMKALMKATIARDYSVAVTSSCNIPTIPLAEAQAMSPRPPSPASRDATQRATRRENTNTLTPHDASVLVSRRLVQTLPILMIRCRSIPLLVSEGGQVSKCRPMGDLHRRLPQLRVKIDACRKHLARPRTDGCRIPRHRTDRSDLPACPLLFPTDHRVTSGARLPMSIVKHYSTGSTSTFHPNTPGHRLYLNHSLLAKSFSSSSGLFLVSSPTPLSHLMRLQEIALVSQVWVACLQ